MPDENNGVDESILEKIQKVLNLAEKAGTQGEAEAAYARATALMTKYAVDQVMLDALGEGGKRDEITAMAMPYGSTYWQATRYVLIELGLALGLQPAVSDYYDRKNGHLDWWGWKSELKTAELMWASLEIQMMQAAGVHMRVASRVTDREERFKEKRSFIIGFGQAVARRVRQERLEARIKESQARGSSGLLPALVSRDDQFREFIDQRFRKGKDLRPPKIHEDGYLGGQRAGQTADLNAPGGRVGGRREELER